MPKLIGNVVRVVEVGGFSIDEYVGQAGSSTDAVSIAVVKAAEPTSEPWLTMQYEEYLLVIKGAVEIHHGDGEVVKARAGQTIYIEKGVRFRPFFTEPGTEYIPVCIPAFTPERCHREGEIGEEDSAVAEKAQDGKKGDVLYHMCQKTLWDAAVASGKAYFPPTFMEDGGFTHATNVKERLLKTANHFYTKRPGDWICLELSESKLRDHGIITRHEHPMSVGEQAVDDKWKASEWVCPHIYGGIPVNVDGIVTNKMTMTRDADGNFLSIGELVGA